MGNKNIVSRTLSVHQEHELLSKLEAAGIGDIAQAIIESKGNDHAIKMVEYGRKLIYGDESSPAVSHDRAREIMGRNYFGPEEAVKYFGLKFTEKRKEALSEIRIPEEVLQLCKDDYLLVADFGSSILDVRSKVERKLFYSHKNSWYNSQAFAKKREKAGWHLILKTPVKESFSKTWNQQLQLLGKDEEVPSARALIYAIIGHYMATGERLFENCYVRTSSVDSGGDRVHIGDFVSDGLYVSLDWDDYRDGGLGVSGSRKS